ncbi:MAG: type 4a pilus biogenesis protein PilO [Selenomonadaceae bacterium]|nr:type 4a pilus biogenesis protein PilO [Selenomonadaceae bacterium]
MQRISERIFGRSGGGRRIWLVFALLNVLLALLWFFFVHRPLTGMQAEAIAKRQSRQEKIVRIENYKNAHLDVKAYDTQLRDKQKAVDTALPDHLSYAEYLTEIQRAALSHGIRLTKVLPGKKEQADGLWKMPLEIEGQTDYFSLLDFLRDIEEQGRFLSFDQTRVQAKDGALLVSMRVFLYAMPETGDGQDARTENDE